MPTTSFTLAGPVSADAALVSIRCSVDKAKPSSFHVEGEALSASQVKEIAVRVRSAILAADLCAWPEGRVTITVESKGAKLVAPALDLPIALTIAGKDVGDLLVAGELGLDGSVRPVRGALQAALLATRGVLLPVRNVREALEARNDLAVFAIGHLSEIDAALETLAELPKQPAKPRVTSVPDFADVRGQSEAVAVVERAVTERAGLLLSGSPGTGKTMIARRIPGLLPKMTSEDQIEVTRPYSAIGVSDGLVTDRPFRAPHHTISATALVGGGSSRRPGEVHLATRGVLFLDEIEEFSRAAIESLATTLDQMPRAARPLIVASANPCPCGWHGSAVRTCTCSKDTITRYTDRVQWAAKKLGLAITATVQPVSLADLRDSDPGESTAQIAGRIATATDRPSL